VSGRVRYGETVRDALFRHLENDLGPMAFPLLPPQPVPFTGQGFAKDLATGGLVGINRARRRVVFAGIISPAAPITQCGLIPRSERS
jgi:hypothetical protein